MRNSITPRYIIGGVLSAVVLLAGVSSCTVVDTGEVGVKTTFGQIDQKEINPGVAFKMPFFTSVTDYNVKETSIELRDLTPKAKDNLSLKDLDISVYYETNGSRVAELLSEYSGQTEWSDKTNSWMPGYGIVFRLARESVYDTISRMDSLTIHQRREMISDNIKERLQNKLNKVSPGSFNVTNVVVRAITTDQSIEKSIQAAVQAQKNLEQKEVQVQIAEKDAEIKIMEAKGIAEANRVINSSLTAAYLKHEENLALMEMAKRGANTVVVPANMNSGPLINVGK